MKVTILQTDIKWAAPACNKDIADRIISANRDSDLYVLPEMWNTGFTTSHKYIPDEADTEDAKTWMRETAIKLKCAVCGSLAIKMADGDYRNRQFFYHPDGTHSYYDKHHLFSLGGEDRLFTPGNRRATVEHMGMRFLMLTCYDLRFPVWSRYKGDYDTIILTANWPAARKEAWDILLKARAIENQCYVIGANRTGQDPVCKYSGNSMVIDPKGNVIASATADENEQAITAEIDIESLRHFRSKFQALRDRDTFDIK